MEKKTFKQWLLEKNTRWLFPLIVTTAGMCVLTYALLNLKELNVGAVIAVLLFMCAPTGIWYQRWTIYKRLIKSNHYSIRK